MYNVFQSQTEDFEKRLLEAIKHCSYNETLEVIVVFYEKHVEVSSLLGRMSLPR